MTLFELNPSDFSLVDDLFAPLSYQLAVPAVLAGTARGRVFVDDPARPHAALLWVGHRLYLAGDSQHAGFSNSLRQWLLEDRFQQQPDSEYGLYYSSPDWSEALSASLLPNHPPVPGAREYYSLQVDQWAGQPVTPSEYVLHTVDQELLARNLEGLDDLTEEMLSERESVEDFLANSFGVVLVDPRAEGAPDGKIITWCLSEYNLGDRCEVGIATDPAYRKRGLAAATGAAFVALARQKGIQHIGWHCWQDNVGSSASARRIGFALEQGYTSDVVIANPVIHLAVHGIVRMGQGQYEAAAEWLARALELGEGPWWVYFRAACAAARRDRPADAFDFLDQAADRGMPGAGWLAGVDHLESLHGAPRWQSLLSRLEGQQQENR